MTSKDMPRVAVITPYFKEDPAWLQRCIASVRDQTVRAEHFLISDGHPQDWIDGVGVRHVRLGRSHGDYGNTPRGLGAQLAVSEGFQAIVFLDADNWLERDHVQSCLSAACGLTGDPYGCDYVVARRRFVRLDGSDMGVPDEPGHVDTNCLLMLPGSFSLLTCWNLMPTVFAPIGDRIFYQILRAKRMRRADSAAVTVNYLNLWAPTYIRRGERPPPGAKPGVDIGAAFRAFARLPERERLWVEQRLGVRVRVDRRAAQSP